MRSLAVALMRDGFNYCRTMQQRWCCPSLKPGNEMSNIWGGELAAKSVRWTIARMVHLPTDVVHIWWTRRQDVSLDRTQLRGLLDSVEEARYVAYRWEVDRVRFLLGVALVRFGCAKYLDCAPQSVRIDRTCAWCSRPHGKVRLVDNDINLSVSHSGDWVGVAFARRAEVGLDVEEVDDIDLPPVGSIALSPGEAMHLQGQGRGTTLAFVRYWVRKEAAAKASGYGLRIPFSELMVSPPNEAPAVLNWERWFNAPQRPRLYDLRNRQNHLACLAIMSAQPLRVMELDGSELLAGICSTESAPGAGTLMPLS